MRVLVHGRSLAGASGARLRMAAGGLALRGHEVWWLGEHSPFGGSVARASAPATGSAEVASRAVGAPPGFLQIAKLGGRRADVVLGGAPIGAAIAGWRAGADAMVLTSTRASVERWSAIDHWCWESLESSVLFEAEDGHGCEWAAVESDRVEPWSSGPLPDSPDAGHADVEILERAAERLLARRSGRLARPAVFLDRDGTLVVEREYLDDPAGIELLPGVPHALRTLAASGFALVVVSNQSGVGRGRFPLATAHATMAALRRALRGHGLELEAVYFCPHHPELECDCRKPGTALLEAAAGNLRLDLRQSTMVGDKRLDAITGQRAGGMGVLVRTGYGREEERRRSDFKAPGEPDLVCEDLIEAAEWIIDRRVRTSTD